MNAFESVPSSGRKTEGLAEQEHEEPGRCGGEGLFPEGVGSC